MKVEGNEIILEHGSISVSANWCGGSQVCLDVSLFIDSTGKHYDCDSIEMAFIEYERITGECHD